MNRRMLYTIAVVCTAGLAACDGSPTDPELRPQYDGRTRAGTVPMTTTNSGGQIGDPCDPATYNGPYRCIPDPTKDNGYVIAY